MAFDFRQRGHCPDLDSIGGLAYPSEFVDVGQVDHGRRPFGAILEPGETVVPTGQRPTVFPEATQQIQRAVESSLADAVEDLEARFGPPSTWRYGATNRMGLTHPLSRVVDEETRMRIDIAPEEKCSAGGTVGTTNASWRQILDVGNWDAAIAMSNPGQSGNPDSPFYRNLWDPWRQCEVFPLLYGRDRIEEETVLRIRLLPD